MKRQKFSLQTILDLREKAKEKAEEVLAAAIRERDLAANRVAQAAARLDELTRMISGERFPAWWRRQPYSVYNFECAVPVKMEGQWATVDLMCQCTRLAH